MKIYLFDKVIFDFFLLKYILFKFLKLFFNLKLKFYILFTFVELSILSCFKKEYFYLVLGFFFIFFKIVV
jgi:hypothetical protein